jgi:hypothetical protein
MSYKTVTTNLSKPVKLSHGQFVVYDKFPENVFVERVINPLSQNDLAEGWQMVLPKPNKNRPTHHYSLYLSELPPHLWKFLKLYTNEDGIQQYRLVRDNIYIYSIRHSQFDDQLIELFEQITTTNPNLNYMQTLVSQLENHNVTGWLMTRARKML